MRKFDHLFEFTEHGMKLFKSAMRDPTMEGNVDLEDTGVAQPLQGTTSFEAMDFTTSKEMAQSILSAKGSRGVPELLRIDGLWAWLTFVLRDQICPRNNQGSRKLGEVHRWYPSNVNDYRKSQRHLVRMPVSLLHTLEDDADHLLSGLPEKPGEVREQLTSQQGMFHRTFQSVARRLYFDDQAKKLKKGASGKDAGSARRLREVRSQLDVTWDLFVISPQQLFDMLPKEFDRFKDS